MVHLTVHSANGFSKVKGLIGKKIPKAILIKTRFGIHTFGLAFPIDILVLDKENTVRVLRHSFSPNGIFLWSPRFDRIIELPEGTIEEKAIKTGEKVTLSFR